MWVAVEDVCVGAGRVVAGVCWVNANVVVWREDGRGRWQASDDAWVDMVDVAWSRVKPAGRVLV